MKELMAVVLTGVFLGCGGSELPADYALPADCLPATLEPIPPTEDDPHAGMKEVYYCGTPRIELVDESGVPVLPVPDGTTVIKRATKEDQDYPWLIAHAEKVNGEWRWTEWTRNFPNEAFAEIPVGEEVCTGCHKKAKSSDWIFTPYTGLE